MAPRVVCIALVVAALGMSDADAAQDDGAADAAWFLDVSLRKGQEFLVTCVRQSQDVHSSLRTYREYDAEGRPGWGVVSWTDYRGEHQIEARVAGVSVPRTTLVEGGRGYAGGGGSRTLADEDGQRVLAAWAHWGGIMRCIGRLDGVVLQPVALSAGRAIAVRVGDLEGAAFVEGPLSTFGGPSSGERRLSGRVFGALTAPDPGSARAISPDGTRYEGPEAGIHGVASDGSWRIEVDAAAEVGSAPRPVFRAVALPI